MEESAHAPFSLSLPRLALPEYVTHQIGTFFPDTDESDAVGKVIGDTLDRLEHCIRHVLIKGFWDHDGPRFNHLHTDQYALFLYYLSNTAFKAGRLSLAAKAYALNKALHGLDAFYEVELPDIWAVVHPVGTVLGRASYSDYFLTYQNVTIGSGLEGHSPIMGEGVVLYAGSRLIGQCEIGNNCLVAAGCTILDYKPAIKDNQVIWGHYPHYDAAPNHRHVKRDIFKDVT